MKKVLFTDLYGTLISPNSSISEKSFGNIERELSLLCRYINAFLKQGNYVVVVTETFGHDRFGFVFNNLLAKINSNIEDDLRSHMAYYFQGKGKIYPEDYIRKEIRNGKIWYIGENHLKGIAIDKKEDAISDFLQMIGPPYQIYGIGDSAKDIPMLLEVEKRGGKSAIIDTYLYRNSYGEGDKTLGKIIESQLDIEFDFPLNEAIVNSRLEVEGRIEYSDSEEEMALLEKRERRRQELYQLLYEGKLDLDEIDRNYSNHFVCSEYRTFNVNPIFCRNKFYENYPFSEEVVQSIMNMTCHSSFGEYYTKVLKRN